MPALRAIRSRRLPFLAALILGGSIAACREGSTPPPGPETDRSASQAATGAGPSDAAAPADDTTDADAADSATSDGDAAGDGSEGGDGSDSGSDG